MEEVIANIRSALISTKGSISLQQLQKDYRDIVGTIIPFKKYGHLSLESFLRSVPSLRVSKLPNGLIVVDAVATDNVKHIVNLVNKQKTSKKKVAYVANRFKPVSRNSYYNKSPKHYKPIMREPVFVKPRPVGNKRRLSVFERLGPAPESSEDLSTFDEDEDFMSKFQSNRKVTSVRKHSLPPNIKITSPKKDKSTSSSSSETWDDASTVLQQQEEKITKDISRLSLLRERISKKLEPDTDRRMTLPAFSQTSTLPPDMVFNNNLPVTNMNILSDFDRPRMRHEHNFGFSASVSGATRPRMPFIPPSGAGILRPNIPRYNQNIIIDKIRPVVTIETTVDHRVLKTEDDKENLDVPKEESYKIDKIKRWSEVSEDEILKPLLPTLNIPKYSEIPNLKSYLDIKISHVNDPSNFYVQPFKSASLLNSLMGKIQRKYSQVTPKKVDIILNGYYCLKHQDGFFYRVQVSKFVSPDHVHVFFIDFGKEEEVSTDELVHVEEEFHQVPYQAIKAKLVGIKPNKQSWSKRESDVFKEMVKGKSFVSVVVTVDSESDLVLGLRLFDTSGDEDINIGKYMVDYGVAQFDTDS